MKKEEQPEFEFKSADCFSPNPYKSTMQTEVMNGWRKEYYGVWVILRFLDLDITLGSRNLAKGKKRKKERDRSASDKVGSGSEDRM